MTPAPSTRGRGGRWVGALVALCIALATAAVLFKPSGEEPDMSASVATTVLGTAGSTSAVQPTIPEGAPPPSAQAPNRSYVVPAAIDPTGGEDVTAALVRFFASVPNGATIEIPSGGHFRIEGTLLLTDRKNLTIDGNGAEFFATTRGSGKDVRERAHWKFERGSNITVRDVIVRGANPSAGLGDEAYQREYEAQHGFWIAGTVGVLLDRVTVTDVYGDFVYLGIDPGSKAWSKDVTVQNSTFDRNGRQGVAFSAVENAIFRHNTIRNVRRSTFDIEPSTTKWGAKNVQILENEIGAGRLLFLASAGRAGTVQDVVVKGNRLVGQQLNILVQPPPDSRRARFSVVENVSDMTFGSPVALIRIFRVDGVEVRDNVAPVAVGRDMTGVDIRESCNATVRGNRFEGAVREASITKPSC